MFHEKYIINSTYLDVRKTLVSVVEMIGDGLDDVQLASFELCLAETLNNIVEHSYKENPDEKIEIEVDSVDGSIRVSIIDQGLPNTIIMKDADSPVPSDLHEGGFGVSLIQRLATKYSYERVNERNITMIWFS